MNATSSATNRLHGLAANTIRQVMATAMALEAGRVELAEAELAPVLRLAPAHPEVLRLQAAILQLRGRADEAVATMRRALSLRPGDALYYNTLGGMLSEAHDNDAAIAALRRACELDPNLALAWFNLGLVLMRCVRSAEAVVALRQALVLQPTHVAARVMLADMLRAGGDVTAAATEYRRVIAQHPGAGPAWWGLADLKTLPLAASDVAQLRAALRDPAASDDDLIALGFALAHALEQAGQLAESLQAIAAANARARQRKVWQAHTHSMQTDAILRAFTPPPAAAAGGGDAVIFVASMPRSGSTLVEQILASHSQVEGGGELPDLPSVLNEEAQRRGRPFPEWVAELTPADWQRLGARYLERTAHWQRDGRRFIDKLPNNWRYIGAARAMLPEAKIICCRRDPLETCLACYRQYFANNEYTRTFADLAAFWRDFDRALRHWRRLHPQHVFEHVYESLVAAPELRIRELLAFCGLSFEPACLDFHQTRREVLTPSAAQVREPIRRDTARAARYGSLLDPLRAALDLPRFKA